MLIPISCTCGRPIGDIYDAFDARRKKLILSTWEKNGVIVDIEKINEVGIEDIKCDLTPIFIDYSIRLECCKSKLMNNVNMYELMSKSYLAALPAYDAAM